MLLVISEMYMVLHIKESFLLLSVTVGCKLDS